MSVRTRPPTHPGGIIKRHYLEPLSLSVSRAAAALGVSRKTLSKIVNERGAVTPEMALRLSKAFHTTPQLWLNLQQHYDLWHAMHDSTAWQGARVISAKAPTAATA
ncbi:MAG: HigA family addiction module antidote protein [Elusimicrobia bacterium]|nr:HigA family addiction module antidote protein [Elusimicrobiota bacterium]